jgi:hypothetical protein
MCRPNGRTIKRVYDEIWKKLDPNMEAISAALKKEDITAELAGIFDRNSSGTYLLRAGQFRTD